MTLSSIHFFLFLCIWLGAFRTSHCAEDIKAVPGYKFADENKDQESEPELILELSDTLAKTVPGKKDQKAVPSTEKSLPPVVKPNSFSVKQTATASDKQSVAPVSKNTSSKPLPVVVPDIEVPDWTEKSFVKPAESVEPLTQAPYPPVPEDMAMASDELFFETSNRGYFSTPSVVPPFDDYSWQYYPAINLSGRAPQVHTLFDDPSLLWSGWINSGMTFNPDSPKSRSNAPVLFNERSNDIQVNQIYFSLQRAISRDYDEFEFGWQADVVFGSDGRYINVPGLENDADRSEKWNSDSSDYGIALPQAFVRFGVPIGNGLDVKVGHFYSTAGFERFPSIQNLLYSHSYIFSYGVPFTHTGIVANYQINPRANVQFGYTRGWDNFNAIKNGSSFIAGLRLGNEDDRQQLNLSFTGGTEFSNIIEPARPVIAPRYYGNAAYLVSLTDRVRFAAEFSGGLQEKGQVVVVKSVRRGFLSDARFWGSAQYLISQLSDRCIGILRTEQFFDIDHNRVGIPISYLPGGDFFNGNAYYAITAGLNWSATSNIIMRPELRFDWSDVKENKLVVGNNSTFRPYNDHTSSSQVTFACDVVVSF